MATVKVSSAGVTAPGQVEANMNGQRGRAIVVTGDLTIDWTIHARQQGVHACPRPGGTMLLASLSGPWPSSTPDARTAWPPAS